jgi:transposase
MATWPRSKFPCREAEPLRALMAEVEREAHADFVTPHRYKLRIVREADEALASGEEHLVGALLRREGLYSSYLTAWRRERDAGELAGPTPKKGSQPLPCVDLL